VKPSTVAASRLVLAKSLGEMPSYWMIEKKISAWLSQQACTGVWIMMAFGEALASRRQAPTPHLTPDELTGLPTKLASGVIARACRVERRSRAPAPTRMTGSA
jgi:hypothetical protein